MFQGSYSKEKKYGRNGAHEQNHFKIYAVSRKGNLDIMDCAEIWKSLRPPTTAAFKRRR
jgi:hypothetical protein